MMRRLGRRPWRCGIALALGLLCVAGAQAQAQDRGTLDPKPLPPLPDVHDPKLAAKQLFGRETTPTGGATHVYGFYSRGCLAGAHELPADGPTWQVMRPSRNRAWGTPHLLAFLQRFSHKVPSVSGWPGILVGDMAQPRGGPMLNGHASHQIGLDADVWLRAMPDRHLTREDREFMPSTNLVASSGLDIDPAKWTPDHMAVLRAAAQDPEVERIFVNAAIKKAICREAHGDRSWLEKIRPMYGHDYHFHIRLACPASEASCQTQEPPPEGEHCAPADLAFWFTDRVLHPKPSPKPSKPPPALTLAGLPAPCGGLVAP
jgi:penicillin-insensitive murein endopeptidase